MASAVLALEDGVVFEGIQFGAMGESFGEAVFNTSLAGYQEILTDPSYCGQIVVMTNPHIGNYGINRQDEESKKPWVSGFVIRELSPVVSNWRSEGTLDDYLKEHHIIGIQGIDTRKLVKHLRDHGAKKSVLSSVDLDVKRLVKKAKASPGLVGLDLVRDVTTPEAYDFNEGLPKSFVWPEGEKRPKKIYDVVCVDGGIKRNILRKLNQHGFKVRVVGARAKSNEILAEKPAAVFYSNGPGDPEPVTYLWQEMKSLIGKLPIFGICLGHQLVGLALGAKTYKLKFGHRGGNHPVMDMRTRRIEITSQNHGFCIDESSLPKDEIEVTHFNLNDKTVEGLRHKKYPLFSVQYHPENSPGPHDSDYLFKRFYDMVDRGEW